MNVKAGIKNFNINKSFTHFRPFEMQRSFCCSCQMVMLVRANKSNAFQTCTFCKTRKTSPYQNITTLRIF